ncbi:BRCA1-associated ATM activator 1 [Hetaerina americana]|uniref:BRCA1-associated ATM activator 1 n=1 Tax=Hetaerina americana TaxID=62018 RepID=UPI003A7F2466
MNQLIEETFSRTLHLLGNPQCKIPDDTYLQLLLSKLSKEESAKKLLILPVCEAFIKNSLEDGNNCVDVSIKVFSLQILALLLTEEEKFMSPEYKHLIIVISRDYNFKESKSSSLQLGYVSLLLSLLNHGSGIKYILEKELWKDILLIHQNDRSIYIRRETQKFIVTLLGAVKHDKPMSEIILGDVFSPMTAKKDVCSSHLAREEDETNPISLTIDLACSILEASLINPLPTLFIFLTGFDLEPFIFHLLDHAIETNPNHGFLAKLGKLLCLFHFNALNQSSTPSDLAVISEKILSLLTTLMKKRSISSVLAVALQSHSCACKIKNTAEVSFEDEAGKRLLLKDQLIYILVTPLLLVSLPSITNELNSNFMSHICETTSSTTQHLAIQLKEAIKKTNSSVDYAYLALVSILQIKDVLDRESAVVAFRSVAFMLWGFARPGVTEISLLISKSPKLLGVVLDGLRSLIELFHLTWRDSLETLCLVTFTTEIIQNVNAPAQVVVQAFQLMKRCIEDFIPPNLALLTNSLQNSSLSQLGPLLEKRIHDLNWEVKDSVYEVLECISSISDYKFPVFQEMLLKNNLCELTVKVGIIDSEPYVRGSALACLTAMVQVTPLWNEGLSALGIPTIAVNILQEESEGLVRKEAAGLLMELYRNNRVVNTFKHELYEVMYAAATKDLHWEVKTKALNFWKAVTEKKLADLGMIDGTFPYITFSKMDRKIVTLDPPKVKELIQNVLEDLSQLGCLRALLLAIKDCDLNVARTAVSHLSYLRTISLQNGLIPEDSLERKSSTCISQNSSSTDSDYLNLLNSLLLANEAEADGPSGAVCSGEKLYINPQKFLCFLNAVDLHVAMEQRCHWLDQCGSNDMLSLLEDILASHNGSGRGPGPNVNDMDCY